MTTSHPSPIQPTDTKPDAPDLVILGGGLAGLTLALQVKQRRPQTRVRVLEKATYPVPEAAHKVGESTVEIAAYYFTSILGLGEHIRTSQLRKNGLRFFFRSQREDPIDTGLEVGFRRFLPTPSYQLDRGIFENHLAERAQAAGVELIDGCRVTRVALGKGRSPHEVTYLRRTDSEPEVVRSSWVIDASGRRALLKRTLGLEREVGHRINSAWFRVPTAIDVETFCDSERWHTAGDGEGPRALSTNHFMGRGYWVWIIPLSSGSTSVGIVADPTLHPLEEFSSFERAVAWLDRNEPACAAAVREAVAGTGGRPQDFKLLKNYAHGAAQVFSADRWALTGDAGAFLDPFYSPGSDFISISNTYISELVCRSLDGFGVRIAAALYEKLYQSFYASGLSLYEGQYPMFGNPSVMPVKILWDYTYYWAVSGPLFFTGKLASLDVLVPAGRDLNRALRLNRRMQDFFRAWDLVEDGAVTGRFLDCTAPPTPWELNRRLGDPLHGREIVDRLHDNIDLLEQVAAEIVGIARRRHPSLPRPVRPSARPARHLVPAYTVLGLDGEPANETEELLAG